MSQRYELIDHTADVAAKCFGENISEAFENAGYAMFDIITDAESIESKVSREIELEADDIEQLLVDWLSELLYILETEALLFSKFDVQLDGTRLNATASGEELDLEKHVLKAEIKAITYHMLEVNRDENYVVVLFDL